MSDRFFHTACAALVLSFFAAAAALVLMIFYLRERADEVSVQPDPPPAEVVQAALLKPVDLPAPPQVSIPLQESVYTITGNAGRAQIMTYTVQYGDSVLTIAERFHLTYCTLQWSNPPEVLSMLLPGTSITILPTDGILYTVDQPTTIADIAAAHQLDPNQLIYSPYNPELLTASPDTVLEAGSAVIIPGGDGGNCYPWQRPPWLTNDDGGSDKLKGCDYLNQFKGYPTNAPMPDETYRISRGYTPGVHEGIDLAAPAGTPVYAAGDGMVRYAGWHPDGYGNLIVIDHGGSYSLYGHLQTINVSCGQPVKAKQLIGGVGSTGNSNANHLHFEVRDGGFEPVSPRTALSKGF